MTRRWPVRPANRPTRRETGAPISRRRQPPPTHCGASRRNGRDLIIATRPAHPILPSHSVSGSGASGTSDPPNRHCYPLHFMRECIPPNLHDPQRAKGSLDRRSKRLSFPHFFLRRKKCGRRRPPPRQGETDSPPGQRPPRKRKKRDGLRRLFLYLISCPCGSATPAPAPARISASCSPPPACRSGCPARSTSRTQTWPR